MNLIELHMLESFPVSCLNRDDLGAPKSAVFGGVTRARVSSQCWKRATRETAHAMSSSLFAGVRTKLIGASVERVGSELGLNEQARKAATHAITELLGKDDKKFGAVKTLMYFSDSAIRKILERYFVDSESKFSDDIIVLLASDDKKDFDKAGKDASVKDFNKAGLKVFGEATSDAADIALFGRMVADDRELSIEGAAMFSHALSTHAVTSELDFFTAVDDEKKNADDAGAGQLGTIEYNSACYYRYIGVNVDLLKESKMFDQAQLQEVLKIFLTACIKANPAARKNSMFAQTLPSYVFALRRNGQPLSLANAFEKAVVASKDGYVKPSIEALRKEWADLQKAFSVKADVAVEIEKGNPETQSLDDLVNALI